MDKKCILVIGSPRGLESTSYKIGNYLYERISESGLDGNKYFLKSIVNKSNKEFSLFINDFKKSDVIILSLPLYVDSIPYIVVKAFELIAEEYRVNKKNKRQNLLAMINSGFPDSSQSKTALKICKKFADEIGINRTGGIKIGAGPVFGEKIEQEDDSIKEALNALDKIADALIKGVNISEEVQEIFNKPPIPGWAYRLVGNIGWRLRASKNNNYINLKDKPYCR